MAEQHAAAAIFYASPYVVRESSIVVAMRVLCVCYIPPTDVFEVPFGVS